MYHGFRKNELNERVKYLDEIRYLELVSSSLASHGELDGHGAHRREEEIFVAQELLHLAVDAVAMEFFHFN